MVDYQLSASKAILVHAARNRDYWLSTFLAVNRRASSRTTPYAFVIPAQQKDPWTRARLLETLRLCEVEIHRAKADFVAQQRRFAAGSQAQTCVGGSPACKADSWIEGARAVKRLLVARREVRDPAE